mgnify:CR=1 FL=1
MEKLYEIERLKEKIRQLENEQKVLELEHIANIEEVVKKYESLKYKGQITAHDINNILSPMIHYSELIRDTDLKPEDLKKYSKKISNSGYMIKNLIQHLEKGPDNVFQLELFLCSIFDIINNILELLEININNANIIVSKSYTSKTKEVYLDKRKIDTALHNLLKNCIESMPSGGHLKIDVTDYFGIPVSSLEEKEYVLIMISDTGTGMTEETLNKLFLPGYTTKKKIGGKGLGMFSSNQYIEEHKGCLLVNSKPRQGTTFRIYIPK